MSGNLSGIKALFVSSDHTHSRWLRSNICTPWGYLIGYQATADLVPVESQDTLDRIEDELAPKY